MSMNPESNAYYSIRFRTTSTDLHTSVYIDGPTKANALAALRSVIKQLEDLHESVKAKDETIV